MKNEQLDCSIVDLDSTIEEFFLDLNVSLENQGSIYKVVFKDDSSAYIALEEDGADKQLSSLVLILVKESKAVTINNNGECSVTLRAYSNKVFLEPLTISPKEIYDKNKFLDLWGIKDLGYLTRKQYEVSLKVSFQLAKEMPKTKVYEYGGWSRSGQEFILGNLKVSANDIQKVEISEDRKIIAYDEKLSVMESCQFINEVYFNVTRDKTYSQIMFLYYFLALNMNKFLKYRMVPSFLLGIIGISGSFKSSSSIPMLNPTDLDSTSFDDSLATIIEIVKNLNIDARYIKSALNS